MQGHLTLPWDSWTPQLRDPQTQYSSSTLPLATRLRDSLKTCTALGTFPNTATRPSITRSRSRTPRPTQPRPWTPP